MLASNIKAIVRYYSYFYSIIKTI